MALEQQNVGAKDGERYYWHLWRKGEPEKLWALRPAEPQRTWQDSHWSATTLVQKYWGINIGMDSIESIQILTITIEIPPQWEQIHIDTWGSTKRWPIPYRCHTADWSSHRNLTHDSLLLPYLTAYPSFLVLVLSSGLNKTPGDGKPLVSLFSSCVTLGLPIMCRLWNLKYINI